MERKEAIEIIKKNYPDSNFTMLREALKTLIPELKESEDEKIRKELIAIYSVGAKANAKTGDIPDRDIVAWLEKQGEYAKFRDSIQIGDEVTRNEDGVLVNLSQLKRVAKKDEKQGEHKLQGKSALEAINEEKVDNANKVEPKFKVGDVMRTTQEAADGIKDGMPVVVSIDEEYYHCTNELIAIKDQDSYEYPPINRRQNTAWSKEDKNRFTKEAKAQELGKILTILDTLEVKEVDLKKLGEIARHLIAVKEHIEDMRLDKEEWLMLEKIGYPERFKAQKGD